LFHDALFNSNESAVVEEVNKLKVKLASLKGFQYLKEGDVVLMKDGSLKKVKSLSKDSVSLVNYNDVVQNEQVMNTKDFDKNNLQIVNDFNKNKPTLSSKLDAGNIDDLSKLLLTFTSDALTANIENNPTDQELGEHFKTCK
jgi:hypothetical protein